MKKIAKEKKQYFIVFLFILMICLWGTKRNNAYAVTTIESLGVTYSFDEKENYNFDGISSVSLETGSNLGRLFLSGEFSKINDIKGYKSYQVENEIKLMYQFNSLIFIRDEKEWNVTPDNSKTVNGIKLNNEILNGAIILQTSLDGIKWVTDYVETDVFKQNTSFKEEFYRPSEIQLQNGCFFKVIIAYKMKKKIEDKKLLFVNVDNYQKQKVAVVYSFYLEAKEKEMSSKNTPRKELGTVVNAGKDNGFSQTESLKQSDPHYGWTIGTFFVNGYTRETTDGNATPVFLKNVGDKVVLWFNLKQDIDCLNGNKKWFINEDTNGYDQFFQTPKTNFKRGTMIIRYTDVQGVKHEPVIYTNYLAANARTGADTCVRLFEEGDYEVALDYEIKNTESLIDEITGYRIFFTFAIRNGNCMVYPFDIITNNELADEAITENGFRLDMARSRYLTIDVQRSIIKSVSGSYVEDVRYNRPAKDGDSYTEEGIYTFNVKNLYTNESTQKTIYVGSNKILKALARNISLDEINKKIADGYKLEEDGALIAPPTPEVTPEITKAVTVTMKPEQSAGSDKEQIKQEKDKEDVLPAQTVPENQKHKSFQWIMIGGIIILMLVALGIVFVIMQKSKMNEESKEEQDK